MKTVARFTFLFLACILLSPTGIVLGAPDVLGLSCASAPCADLVVSHAVSTTTIDASADARLTLTVRVMNLNAGGGAASIPAGARVLVETLPSISAAPTNSLDDRFWDSRGLDCTYLTQSPIIDQLGFGACGVRPGDPVDAVQYVSFDAPQGYTCTPPAAAVSSVSCTATRNEVIKPGAARTFKFTLAPFDISHPYLHVEDADVQSGQPLVVTASAEAQVNPDGAISESNSVNDTNRETIEVHAPLLRILHPELSPPYRGSQGDCPLSLLVMNPVVTTVGPGGEIQSTGTFSCGLRLRSVQSTAPAKLAAGALHMDIHADVTVPVASSDRQQVTATMACSAEVQPLSSNRQRALQCASRSSNAAPAGVGGLDALCTTTDEVTISGDDVLCQMSLTATVDGTPDSFGYGQGGGGLDVAPVLFYLQPEIIRFASPGMLVKAQYDLYGGSVGFD